MITKTDLEAAVAASREMDTMVVKAEELRANIHKIRDELAKASESGQQGILINCIRCGNQLKEPGGLLFSPPETIKHRDLVVKYHICITCYPDLMDILHG